MKSLFILFLLLLALPAEAAGSSAHEACRRLCENEGDCVRRCVGHVELMEVKANLVNTAADFDKSVEVRMTALRSGASIETFSICGNSGWSTHNKLICLRSYPSPELMKSCKTLSSREADQVRCLRNGKSSADIDTCNRILVSPDLRLECLGLQITAKEMSPCEGKGSGSRERLDCLRRLDRSPASR